MNRQQAGRRKGKRTDRETSSMYVLSGGPSCGKTSTLKELQRKGFVVVPEAARDIIEREAAKGTHIPSLVSSLAFQIIVAREQLRREKQITGTAFLDRGLPDNLGYYKFYRLQTPQEVLEACASRPYRKVFLLEMLPIWDQDTVRTESLEVAKKLERLIEQSYKEFGYPVVRVPVLPLEERVEFILKKAEVNAHG